jgi:hypothetical protein
MWNQPRWFVGVPECRSDPHPHDGGAIQINDKPRNTNLGFANSERSIRVVTILQLQISAMSIVSVPEGKQLWEVVPVLVGVEDESASRGEKL